MSAVIRKLKRALLNRDPSFCDMYEDAHAREAAEEYLGHIRRHLQARFPGQSLAILDAGCQAGRLLVPLAQDGHTLTGIDTSGFALRRARQHARAQPLPIRLHRGGIAQLRRWIRRESLDAVVCTEVLYLCRDHRQLLQLLAESVKPGGLLFVSHRPTLFYVAAALRQGDIDFAGSLVRGNEGRSPDGAYHNWQSPEQLVALYREFQLRVLGCYPLDLAEMPLDLSAVTDPQVKGLLDEADRGGHPAEGGVAAGSAGDRRSQADRTDLQFRIPRYTLVVAQR